LRAGWEYLLPPAAVLPALGALLVLIAREE